MIFCGTVLHDYASHYKMWHMHLKSGLWIFCSWLDLWGGTKHYLGTGAPPLQQKEHNLGRQGEKKS